MKKNHPLQKIAPKYKPLVLSFVFLVTFFSIFDLAAGSLSAEIEAYELATSEITAEAALVMNYDTGEILWQKNSKRLLYPASLTKIMSCILAIEMIDDMERSVTISENAEGRNSSFFTFYEGDRITLGDLLKAALINSHNNATIALAENLAGDEQSFIDLMNKKAREIGAVSTIFENTSGLDSEHPHHRSTAQDMALISRYAMQNDTFREIVNIREDYIKINDEDVYIFNTNKLLLYGHIKGIKTGFTNNAGPCIVIYSEKDDLNLVTVILNSEYEKREKDVMTLLRWAYVNLKNENIIDSQVAAGSIKTSGSTTAEIEIFPEKDLSVFLNRGSDTLEVENTIVDEMTLPVKKGQEAGKMEVYLNGVLYETVGLVAGSSYDDPVIEQRLVEGNRVLGNKWVYIFLIGFYFFVFIFIIIRNLIRPGNQ